MKNLGTLARLLTVLVLIVGTFGTLEVCGKVVETGANLIVLNDNASYYNEQYFKTDEMTRAYERNQAKRMELYNSEDPIIRGYSNMWALPKLLCFFLAIAMYPGVCLVWIYVILNIYFKMLKKLKQQKHKKSQSRTYK